MTLIILPSTPNAPPLISELPFVATSIKAMPLSIPLTLKLKTFPWKQFHAACIQHTIHSEFVLSINKHAIIPNKTKSIIGIRLRPSLPKCNSPKNKDDKIIPT